MNASLSVTLGFSLYVSKEEYDENQEVRNFVGVQEDDFSGIYTDTESTLQVCFDFEVLKQPPMVISSRLISISGPSTSYVIK